MTPACFRAASALAASVSIAGCGGQSKPPSPHRATPTVAARTTIVTRSPQPRPPQPAYPRLLGAAGASQPTPGFVPAVSWHGRTAVWIARSPSGLAMLSVDQRLAELHLHSGTIDAGASGWGFGPMIAGLERNRLIGAFNGGFKLSTGAGGFESYGRVAVPPSESLGSIVTYSDGSTDIGSWHHEVPAAGRALVSARQNLTLLIDGGHGAASLDCVSCWGATLGGVPNPARSALGITADGHLIWAGGEQLTVSALVSALLAARVIRALELDINPEWVAGYLYSHRRGQGTPAPLPVVPGQQGIPGQFLAPWSRDFFAVAAR